MQQNGYRNRNNSNAPSYPYPDPREVARRQAQVGQKPQGQQRRPANPTQRPQGQRPKHPAKKSFKIKRPSVLVCTFLVLALVAMIILIAQCAKGDDGFNIMGLFETEPAEYDTSAVANRNEPTGGVVYAEVTKNTKALNIDSANGILLDISNNTVIAAKGGDERIYPASMTKVMTLIVAYEHIDDLDDTFTFSFDIVNDAYVAGASVAGFSEGETVPLRDLLYGCVLPSGADCTSGLAEYVAGSEEGFAALMNQKVEEMGLTGTHFVTASGLHDDNHYSTCHDMAKILEYAIANPELREILGTYTYTTTPTSQHPNGIQIYSTMYQKMAGDEADGIYVQGGKTGYTPEAHNCLASFAAACTEETADTTKPRYILVTAGGIGEYAPIYDAIDVYSDYTG